MRLLTFSEKQLKKKPAYLSCNTVPVYNISSDSISASVIGESCTLIISIRYAMIRQIVVELLGKYCPSNEC